MKADDADLTLILIALNAVKYANPVEDPVFSAHKPFLRTIEANMGLNQTIYFSDWANGVMGCREQVTIPLLVILYPITDGANSTNFVTRGATELSNVLSSQA